MDVGREVKAEMELKILNLVELGCPTRQEAARVLLRWYPKWFWQTPEGEYLEHVSKDDHLPVIIEAEVKDHLAQKFNAMMLEGQEQEALATRLWNQIFPEDKR